MNSINVSGVSLEVEHIPGPTDRVPLVFLHEGLGSVSQWQQRGQHWPAQLCAASGRPGWMYSRRGYGQSDPVEDVRGKPRRHGPWHVGRHEPDYMHLEANEVLPQVLQQLGISRPILIGHSDGATIALLHAAHHTVAGCVAMAPHVFVEELSLAAIARAKQLYETEPHGNGSLRQRLARHHRDVDNAFWQWNDVWLSEAFRSFDIRAETRLITAPLLLLQGVDDEYGSMEQISSIETATGDVTKIALIECGHSPHRDQPDKLTAEVQHFLRSLV